MKRFGLLLLALAILVGGLCACTDANAKISTSGFLEESEVVSELASTDVVSETVDESSEETPRSSAEEGSKVSSSAGMSSIYPDFVNFNDDSKSGYCTATINDNFDDHTLSVVLTKKKSWEKREFTPADFPEIECIEVKNLNSGLREQIEEQQTALKELGITSRDYDAVFHMLGDMLLAEKHIPEALINPNDGKIVYLADPNAYRASLSLKLKNTGKENVLAAVRILEQRNDILGSSPNFITTMQPVRPNVQ